MVFGHGPSLRWFEKVRVRALVPLWVFRLTGQVCDEVPLTTRIEIPDARCSHCLCGDRMVQGMTAIVLCHAFGVGFCHVGDFRHLDQLRKPRCPYTHRRAAFLALYLIPALRGFFYIAQAQPSTATRQMGVSAVVKLRVSPRVSESVS